MAVKQLRSGSRVLAVLEAVAVEQPVGLSELVRTLELEKSGIHRALTTLANEGWIRRAADTGTTKWELTTRILVVAHEAERRSDLRRRGRAALEHLRDETGESVLLAALDANQVVTLDVVESSHLMRTVPRVGMVIPSMSAAGLAALAHLEPDALGSFLGVPPSSELVATLDEVRSRGWSLNYGDVAEYASAVAAAVLDRRGYPAAVLAISAPNRAHADLQSRAAGSAGRRGRDTPVQLDPQVLEDRLALQQSLDLVLAISRLSEDLPCVLSAHGRRPPDVLRGL